MLYYDKIDVSEGIDVNKTTELCKCIIPAGTCRPEDVP